MEKNREPVEQLVAGDLGVTIKLKKFTYQQHAQCGRARRRTNTQNKIPTNENPYGCGASFKIGF
ncbi:hypothetical protein QIU19_08370 [Capnocytophaga canimorsus]|nr:hypothetical protein [Capnocytophaga canimorsus]WGU67571.1 hypothetical protein QIU19_08370 [Capnocytophaga canimorsus]